MPQPNGTIYTFGRDVNILWRHGILQVSHVTSVLASDWSEVIKCHSLIIGCPQVPPDQQKEEGRVSIIAWGWVPQTEL